MKTKRFFKRINVASPVEFEINGYPQRLSGEIYDLSCSGARLVTANKLASGQKIRLYSLPSAPLRWVESEAEIVWTGQQINSKNQCGIKFADNNKELSDVIRYIIGSKVSVSKFKSVIFWSLVALSFLLPFIHALGLRSFQSNGKYFFSAFIILIAVERIWETFYTSREQKTMQGVDDWTISAVTFYYVLMLVGSSIEFYIVPRQVNFLLSGIGAGLLSLSFLIRWWGVKTLGNQWAIHAVGTSKLGNQKREIVKNGPYKFIRHPIYLGVILEIISIPLIPNTFYTLIFVILVNIPLQVLRSRLEEHTMFSIFSIDFIRYKGKIGGYFPKNMSRKSHEQRQGEKQQSYMDSDDWERKPG